MKLIKRIIGGTMLAMMALYFAGCAYGGAAGVSNDHVVVLKNDAFLMGFLRTAYVCKATPSGLSACRSSESP